MTDILLKALAFVFSIFLGFFLKKIKVLKKEDFYVLSKVVIKVTLPASIIVNFSGAEVGISMLLLTGFGLLLSCLMMVIGFTMNIRRSKNEQAFGVLNVSGYNIGNFTMPFVQSFLGASGVVVTSLFDAGNALVCLGGSYSVASMVKDKNGRFSVLRILKTVFKSVPFDVYVLMTVLAFIHIALPEPVITILRVPANANPFLAMFMFGVGFELGDSLPQLKKALKYLGVRFGVSILFALGIYFLLPVPLEIRQPLTLLVLSPIATAAPAFTADIGEDYGLASAINSLSVVISIVLILATLFIML